MYSLILLAKGTLREASRFGNFGKKAPVKTAATSVLKVEHCLHQEYQESGVIQCPNVADHGFLCKVHDDRIQQEVMMKARPKPRDMEKEIAEGVVLYERRAIDAGRRVRTGVRHGIVLWEK